MSIDIEPRHFDKIKEILNNIVPNSKVFVFGSRANNCAKPYSDLDIAIDCNSKKLDLSIMAKLKFAFEETTIPYTVDVIDLNSITDEFKNNIKNDLVKLEF